MRRYFHKQEGSRDHWQRWGGGWVGEGAGLWYIITTITVIITITTIAGGSRCSLAMPPSYRGAGHCQARGPKDPETAKGDSLWEHMVGLGRQRHPCCRRAHRACGIRGITSLRSKTETKPGTEGWESPPWDQKRAWARARDEGTKLSRASKERRTERA